jgi:hypothetical protein
MNHLKKASLNNTHCLINCTYKVCRLVTALKKQSHFIKHRSEAERNELLFGSRRFAAAPGWEGREGRERGG